MRGAPCLRVSRRRETEPKCRFLRLNREWGYEADPFEFNKPENAKFLAHYQGAYAKVLPPRHYETGSGMCPCRLNWEAGWCGFGQCF